MRLRPFGPLDVQVPVLGLGAWQMEADDRESAIQAIRRAIALGLTHIDTAELYGRGAVEELVGEALAGHRAGVFLASKVMPSQATFAGTLRSCEMSLRRLRTDRLDLYMLHWLGDLPLEPTIRALETLQRDGKVRAWGVSNFDVPDLERAIEMAGPGAIACNQVLYNLAERDTEHVLQTFCERNRIAFVGYSPLGAGNFPRSPVLARIAAERGVSVAAVVLAFLVRHPNAFTIPKTSRAARVDEAAQAADLVLTSEEIAAIDDAFPLEAPKSELPML